MAAVGARGATAMDVGADEFEQNLPLLQELVQGADFLGKVRGSGPGRRALCAGGACGGGVGGGGGGGGGAGRGGGVRPGRGSR